MSFGSIVFTNKGKILQAKAQAGAQLTFTRLAMGDGQLTGQSETELSNVINKKKDIAITKLRPMNNGAVAIGGILSNSDLAQGFYWREIGLFANDPDVGEVLYCYGNAGTLAEYIPAGEGSQILEKRIDIIAITGNAPNVSAVIDSSLIFLSVEDLERHNDDLYSHPDIRESIGELELAVENIEVPVTSVNGKTGAVSLTANDVGAVPTARTVNGKALSSNVSLTKSDIGLSSVENYGIATTAEAQAGTVNNKYMTPALVKTAVQYLAQTGGISMVKSVQRGTVIPGRTTVNIPISAVNVSKSLLIIQSLRNGGSSSEWTGVWELTSSSITLDKAAWDHPVLWQVIEYM